MDKGLRVRDYSVSYATGRGPLQVLEGVGLTVGPGEVLGLVGESGSGKSTLACAVMRTLRAPVAAESGDIALGGVPLLGLDESRLSSIRGNRIAMVFQHPGASLNPTLTLGEHFRIADLLSRVQLPRHFSERYPHELSGGEKQRVAIARALGAEPQVIVCDEITSGLDASVQAAVVNLLREIQSATGVSLLFITHDLKLLRHVADRVAVMYLGRIVEIRDAARLAEPPYHPYTEALLSSAPALEAGLDVRRVRLAGVIPSRIGQLNGCPFESRCPRRIGTICRQAPPPEIRAGEGHVIACHIDAAVLEHVPPIWQIRSGASIRFRRDGGSVAATQDTVDGGGTSK